MPSNNRPPIKRPGPVKPASKPIEPKGPFHFKGIEFHVIFISFAIGLCFLLYGNTIPNGFSLDDEFVLHNDTTIAKGVKGIPQLFKKRYAWDQKGGYGYRPVVKAVYALEYVFFKDSAHWGHVINILFYAGVCIFMFYFFRKILYDHIGDYFLLIAITLFIVHPLHTEVVASLKNRDEMLVFLFGFYTVWAFVKCFELKSVKRLTYWIVLGVIALVYLILTWVLRKFFVWNIYPEKNLWIAFGVITLLFAISIWASIKQKIEVVQILLAFSACLSLGFGSLCKPDAFIFIPITLLVLYFFTPKERKLLLFQYIILAVLLLIPVLILFRGYLILPFNNQLSLYHAGDIKFKQFLIRSAIIGLRIVLIMGIPATILTILYLLYNKILRAPLISLVSMMYYIILGNRYIIQHILPHTDYQRTFIFIENPLVGVHWFHKIPLAFSTAWFYLSKLVFPKDLISYYGYDAFNSFPDWTNFSVIAGILIIGLLVFITIKNLRNNKVLLFLLLLFAGTLFPYTDLFQVGAGVVAERFMFLPSVAFAMLVVYLLFNVLELPLDKKPIRQKANYAYGFLIVVGLVCASRVIARNPDWKSHQSLYLHDSKLAPRSAKLQSLLAATYVERAQKLKTENPQNKQSMDSNYLAGNEAYKRSVDIYPEYGTSWNNLGMIQYTLYGNLPVAISDFTKALKVDTAYAEAWFNMGACYEALSQKINDTVNLLRHDSASIADSKHKNESDLDVVNKKLTDCEGRLQYSRDFAERSYLSTIRLKPENYLDYIYLTRLYFSEGKFDKVIEFDNHAIVMGYQSDVVYVTMGNAYLMEKDTADAVNNYEHSIQFYDKNYVISNFLKTYFYKRGDRQKARYYAGKYDTAMMYKNSLSQRR